MEKVGISSNQISGKFRFTNQRVIFDAGMIKAMAVHFEWEGKDITETSLCNVGGIMPTGIKLTMNGGETIKISLLNRKKWLALIEAMRA